MTKQTKGQKDKKADDRQKEYWIDDYINLVHDLK